MAPGSRRIIREYFELIAETAVFVLFIITFVVQPFRIPTGSMIPKLLVGDFLLVNKMAYARPVLPLEGLLLPHRPLERWNIVVFKWPGDPTKDYVKRLIGLEGDKVEIRGKQLYVNDQAIDEPYKIHKDSQGYARGETASDDLALCDKYGPIIVPKGHLFMMGDNRDDSADSRTWGYVPREYVKGRPWIIYYSYEAGPYSADRPRLGDRLKALPNFLLKARWRRLLKVVN